MTTTELEQQLENALEALDGERVKAADLASALAATEMQVAGLAGQLRAGRGDSGTGDSSGIREELERQKAAAEEYRVEAADMRSMFDAMQHRIDVLQQRAVDDTEVELRRSVEELESKLGSTRRARDQWLERLEESGREKQELEKRLAAAQELLEAQTVGVESAARDRIAGLEGELAELRSQVEAAEALLEESATGQEASSSRIGELEGALSAERNGIGRLEAELAGARSQIEAAESLLEESSANEETSSLRAGDLEGELSLERDGVGRLEGELSALRALLEAADAGRQDSSSGQEALAQQNEALAQQVEELESDVSARGDRVAELERALSDQLARTAALEAERDAADVSAQSDRDLVEGLVAECDRAEQLGRELGESHGELRHEFGVLAEDLVVLSSLSDELRSDVTDDHRRSAEFEARFEECLESRRESRDRELALAVERVAGLEAELRDAGKMTGAIAELREQMADVEAQRSALAAEVESERARNAELEKDAEEARAAAARGADASAAADGTEHELASLRSSFDAAVKGHADEVRALKDDVDLQTAVAHDRDRDVSRLSEECSILQQSVEDAISELEGVRAERRSLTEQLRDIEDSEVAARTENANGGGPAQQIGDAQTATPQTNGRLDDALEAALLDVDVGAEETRSTSRDTVAVLVEDDPTMRSALESAVGKVAGVRCGEAFPAGDGAGAAVRLVANLAAEDFELDMFSDLARMGLDEAEMIAYCAKDGRGVFLRNVSLFPPPCDLDECAARLLSATENLQRLLVVGEDVDFMSGLRESLGRVRCSTAIAFDGRQVVDLIPMVKPQVVVVDLNLPRGGGLRVAAQIATNPDLRHILLAMFWREAVDPVVFRQQAIFSMRDFYLGPDDLTRGVTQALSGCRARGVGGATVEAGLGGGAVAAVNPPGN